MKVTIENKKGLNKDIKVFIDKKTMSTYMDEKYEQVKMNANLKGFRPGKIPREILKRQFGEAIFGEVLDKVLKDISTKALEENKIKPAGQPKIDLKVYGEDKDLEYIISVTEIPKIDIKPLENIKFDEYSVEIDDKETEKRIEQMANNQDNFKEVEDSTKSLEGYLVAFDYKATIGGKNFKGGEGKNTQLVLGKDLFIKGFDKHLIGVKKNDEKKIETILPENYPEKEFSNKKAVFDCKILMVKKPEKIKINDDFAKNLGAKDLNNLKELISKQINSEYKNSLDALTNKQILKEVEKIKVNEIPENLKQEEIKILTSGLNDEDVEKDKKKYEEQAINRIKTGLILNAFGEENKIKVTEQEIQTEIQNQLRSMPGQEKMLEEYYKNNPSLLANLRGSLYEEKIIKEIKLKAKPSKKVITKEKAEILLKEENEKNLKKHSHHHSQKIDHDHQKNVKKVTKSQKTDISKKTTPKTKKIKKAKKVSKK